MTMMTERTNPISHDPLQDRSGPGLGNQVLVLVLVLVQEHYRSKSEHLAPVLVRPTARLGTKCLCDGGGSQGICPLEAKKKKGV